jgi:hypothetical protein
MTRADPTKVLRLYDVERLSIRAIAKRLGVSYGSVHRIVSTRTVPRSDGRPLKRDAEVPPCGSRKAYQRHIRFDEKPDELCRQANNDYIREFNRRTGGDRARNRAYRRLAAKYPDLFRAVLTEERQRVELESPEAESHICYARARERTLRRLAKLYPRTFQLVLDEEKVIAQNEILGRED